MPALLDPPALRSAEASSRYEGIREFVFDVTDPKYGADKTGNTDASDAITAAYSDCYSNGGGIVYFPPGTYLINKVGLNCIFLFPFANDWIVFKGAGRYASKIKLGSNTPAAFGCGGNPTSTFRYIGFEDLTFDANNVAPQYAFQSPMFNFFADSNLDGLEIRRCDVINCGSITAPNVANRRCIDVTLSAPSTATAVTVKNVLVENCYLGRSGGGGNIGVQLSDFASVRRSANEMWNTNVGQPVGSAYFDQIMIKDVIWDSGSVFTGDSGGASVGILIGGHGQGGRVTVDNCRTINSSDDLLEFNNVNNTTVKNCEFDNGFYEGVFFNNGSGMKDLDSQRVQIIDCIFRNIDHPARQLFIVDHFPKGHFTIKGCTFYSEMGPNYYFLGSHEAIVIGNVKSVLIEDCRRVIRTKQAGLADRNGAQNDEGGSAFIRLVGEGQRTHLTVKDCVLDIDYAINGNGYTNPVWRERGVDVIRAADASVVVDNFTVNANFRGTNGAKGMVSAIAVDPTMAHNRLEATYTGGSGSDVGNYFPDSGLTTDLNSVSDGVGVDVGVSLTGEQRWVWVDHYDGSRHHSVWGPWTDVAMSAQFVPGSTLTGLKAGAFIKRISATTYIEAYVSDDGSSSYLNLDKVVAGTRTALGTPVALTRVVSGTAFWVMATIQARTVTARYFTLASGYPGLSTTADNTISATLSSTDDSTVGPAVQGNIGIVFIPAHQAARWKAVCSPPMNVLRATVRNVKVNIRNGVSEVRGIDWRATSVETRLRELTIQQCDFSGLAPAAAYSEFYGLTDRAHLLVTNRAGNAMTAPMVKTAITVPSSASAWTNSTTEVIRASWRDGTLTTPYAEVSTDGGTNWTQLTTSNSGGLAVMFPGDKIRWTYSVVPTADYVRHVDGKQGDAGSAGPVGSRGAHGSYTTFKRPTGAIAESFKRAVGSYQSNAPGNGTVYVHAIALEAGQTVNWIGFLSGSTAGSGLNNVWFLLTDASYNVLGKTTDDAASGWAANTFKKINLATPYSITASGIYYIGLCVNGTTRPTLQNISIPQGITGKAPATVGVDARSVLTDPASCPSVLVAGQVGNVFYGALG